MITTGSGVPTPQEPEITEEMIEASAVTLDERIPWDQHAPAARAVMRLQAAAVLKAALAGRTVVPELPAPDGVDEGVHVWVLPSGEVQASQGAGEGLIYEAHGDDLLPDEAEQYGAALIAAAREARRLASESRKDGETQR